MTLRILQPPSPEHVRLLCCCPRRFFLPGIKADRLYAMESNDLQARMQQVCPIDLSEHHVRRDTRARSVLR